MSDNRNRITRSPDIFVIFLLVAMIVWFSHEMVWGGKVPFFRDLGPYFYPMRFSLAESFKAGELPLWDRHVAMGFPLLADFQSAAFYPPHLLYLILPFFDATRALFLFHYLVAATGSYMLCRQWSYPRYLAVIGAVLFTLGGTIVSLSNLLNHFQTAVWLPWVILLGERSLHSGSWKDFLGLTFVALAQFLAGSPEFYMMSMALLILDGMRVKRIGGNTGYAKTFFLLGAANILVLGLSMIQVLPTMELFSEGRRPTGMLYQEIAGLSLHPLNLVNLFFLDKEIDISMGIGLHLFFIQDLPFFISYYTGAISLFGICLWLYFGSRKEKGVFSGLIVITLVIALGTHTPIYSYLFQYIPVFRIFRFPEKFFFLTYVFLVFITLRGLYEFLERDDRHKKWPLLIPSSIFVLFLVLYLICRFEKDFLIRFIGWAMHTPSLSPSTISSLSTILFHLERQIVLSFGILFLLFLYKFGKVSTSLFQGLIVGLVFFDLFSAHQPYQFLVDPNRVRENSRIISAPDPEASRLFYIHRLNNLHPSQFTFKERPFAGAVSSVFATLIPNTGVFHGFDYMQEMDALSREPYDLFLRVSGRLPPERVYHLLGALNVKYVNSSQSLPKGGITLVRHLPEHPFWLYRIDAVIPRTYIVPKAIEEKDPLKILDRLSSKEFDPLKEVILERPLSVPSKENMQASAEIVAYTNHRVRIRASLDSPGVLVLADSFYPGWHVYVDGEEKEILRANLFFRGVPLSPGKHWVEFRYEPLSFAIGLAISLTTLFGLTVGTILFLVVRGKKSASLV